MLYINLVYTLLFYNVLSKPVTFFWQTLMKISRNKFIYPTNEWSSGLEGHCSTDWGIHVDTGKQNNKTSHNPHPPIP